MGTDLKLPRGDTSKSKILVFAEGSRGNATKKLTDRFDLDDGKISTKYTH